MIDFGTYKRTMIHDADYIRTPFYRTVAEDGNEDINPQVVNSDRLPHSNYRPYQLFALRTRFQPIVNRLYPSEFEGEAKYAVRYNMRMLDGKLTNVIQLYDGNDYLMMKGRDRMYLQQGVDWILGHNPDMSLLLSNTTLFMSNSLTEGPHTLISDHWTRRMVRFLRFNSDYRAHIRPASEYQIHGLYIDLSMRADYQQSYNNLYMGIARRINQLYNDGYIVLPISFNSLRLKKWGLASSRRVPSNTENGTRNVAFHPIWKDRRLTDPVGGPVAFLHKHVVTESNLVLIDTGSDDIIRRHQVAKSFESSGIRIRFRNNFVEVEVDNLRMAQRAAYLVDLSKHIVIGKVFNMYASQPRLFNTILTVYPISNSTLEIQAEDMIGYQIDDPEYRYCLSCQVPYESDAEYYYKALNRWYQNYINNEPVVPLIVGTEVEIPIEPQIVRPVVIEPRIVERQRPKIELDDLGRILTDLGKPNKVEIVQPRLPPISGILTNLGLTPAMVAVGA
jgi:hypothetical protein